MHPFAPRGQLIGFAWETQRDEPGRDERHTEIAKLGLEKGARKRI
jgi:hypothetical protein